MLIGLVGWFWIRLWSWLAIMGLLTIVLLLIGWGITGLFRGVLIDERNKVTLSRLQAALWTVLVLGAFLAGGINNVKMEESNPLSIKIPVELWWVMGIATTSLVGSLLVRSVKEKKTANRLQASETFRQLGVAPASSQQERWALTTEAGDVIARGQIVVNTAPESSRWTNLFKGGETSNAAQVDLGKVQMFFFTLILLLAYGVALGRVLGGEAPVKSFPALDEGMIAILGISHAAYLANKTVPRTLEES